MTSGTASPALGRPSRAAGRMFWLTRKRFFGSYFAFTDFMIDDEAEGRVQATYANIRRRRPESNGLAAAHRLPSVSSMIRRFV
jgi:hypothetical protein